MKRILKTKPNPRHLPLVLFILLFAALGSYFLINSFAASNPNVYIAQSATGSANGTDCADAEPVSFFNTSTNWGTNSSQIGPGTTVHLCGTITTALTAQGSGVSGSPITILWEAEASLSKPFCLSTGCFNTNNQTYLTLDGGSNGIIQATANGTGLANQQAGNGITAYGCDNCTIKNLTIQNIYQHTSTSDTNGNAQSTGGIAVSGNNFVVTNNTIHDTGDGVYFQPGATDANDQVDSNNIYNVNWGVTSARQSNGGTIGPLYVYGNHFHDWANWDTTTDQFHHNGLHCYTAGGLTTLPHYNGLYVYNNRFDGTEGVDGTADVWPEPASLGSPCGDASSNIYVFNNVFNSTDNTPGDAYIYPTSGNEHIWNNTLMAPSTTGNRLLFADYGGTLDLSNNLFDQANTLVDDNTSAVTLSPAPDYNFFANGGSNAFVCNGFHGFPSGFTSWQTCTGGDTHGMAYSGTFSLNSDGSLQSGSPAIGAGANLTSICSGQPNPGLGALCSDINGNPRPSTGSWDVGAYQSLTANLWVSTTGGSCTRSTTPAVYNASTACGSLGAAYTAAACGDLVYIRGGDYSGSTQTLTDSPTKDTNCTQPVVLKGYPGETPIFSTISTGSCCTIAGASWWTLDGVSLGGKGTFDAVVGVDTNMSGSPIVSPSHITIEHVTGGHFHLRQTTDATVQDNSFGPCWSDSSPSAAHPCIGNDAIDGANNNVMIAHNTIANYYLTTNHFECMYIFGGSTNVMVDSNKFSHCELYPIAIDNAGGSTSNLTIQNNWFGTGSGSTSQEQSGINFQDGGSGQNLNNVLIRYNSFAPSLGVAISSGGAFTGGSTTRVIGNIGGSSCGGSAVGWVYSYNVWTTSGGKCAATDTAVTSLPYVNLTQGSEDFHLTPGSIAQNFVTPNTTDYQLNYDLDGNTRPTNGPRDAGSEQYSSTATSGVIGDLNADGHVNIFDLSIFLSHWQQTGTGLPEDFNADNIVNIFDLSILLSHYGA